MRKRTEDPFTILILLMLPCILMPFGKAFADDLTDKTCLDVTVTAYTSRPQETKRHGDTHLTAWGDTLSPGVKTIAVSRDLIPIGLKHGTRVRIQGLQGYYVVWDVMNARWRRKIDIYFGHDYKMAKIWGRKKRTICWEKKPQKPKPKKEQAQEPEKQPQKKQTKKPEKQPQKKNQPKKPQKQPPQKNQSRKAKQWAPGTGH